MIKKATSGSMVVPARIMRNEKAMSDSTSDIKRPTFQVFFTTVKVGNTGKDDEGSAWEAGNLGWETGTLPRIPARPRGLFPGFAAPGA